MSNHITIEADSDWKNVCAKDKWESLKHQLFCSLFEDKKGCLITSVRHSHEETISNWDTIIEKRGNLCRTKRTFLMPKTSWPREDLWKLATSSQLDVSDIWMSPNLDAEAALKLTEQDLKEFWKFLLIPAFYSRDLSRTIEFMGSIGDGDLIMWTNPSPHKIDSVLDDLKKLAAYLEVPIEEI